MTLSELNAGEPLCAREALLECCGSSKWADQMIGRRPFADASEISRLADEIWWSLDRTDWLEAFSKHPKIGEKKPLSAWSSEEQRGMKSASDGTARHISELNEAYEKKFGWIFIVFATGKNSDEIETSLEARLANTHSEELRIAAGEQAKITHLRLRKLLGI